jgi:hypothetical protein
MVMKNVIFKQLAIAALLAGAVMGCKNEKAEERVADLEVVGVKPTDASPAADQAVEPKPEGPLGELSFSETSFDFGTVKEGQIIEHTFNFTNTGEAPLVIQNAQASCGCTVPDWTKTPIPPGGKGFVKAKFDSNGRPNLQKKTVTVVANTWPQQTVLRFQVMVTPKPDQPDAGPLKQ